MKNRVAALSEIEKNSFDLCVIGGGATGAGCALDAQLRGLRTVLIEAGDFACATSSSSTKLIHGGVRYLEQAISERDVGQYHVVKRALRAAKNHARQRSLSGESLRTHGALLPLVRDLLLPWRTRWKNRLLGIRCLWCGLWSCRSCVGRYWCSSRQKERSSTSGLSTSSSVPQQRRARSPRRERPMDVHAALKSQYHASLAMLKETIDQCPGMIFGPEALSQSRSGESPTTRSSSRTSISSPTFRRFVRGSITAKNTSSSARCPFRRIASRRSANLTRSRNTRLLATMRRMVDTVVDRLDLDAAECGFPWYNCPKFDHQIINIRHLQHHAAMLSGRLRSAIGADIEWIGVC